MLRSGLIIEVPAAEPAVAGWRAQLDALASVGVPAHVTVLFPFAAPESIDEPTLESLGRLFAATEAFEFTLTRTAWFEDRVLWLAPQPAAPFERLTRQVAEAFPSYPPYGGRFADVVPHLTVGDHRTPERLRAAESALQQQLPIVGTATAVTLLVEHSDGRWRRRSSFPLG